MTAVHKTTTTYGRMRDPIGPGMNWDGAWKSWVAKDAIKPLNMQGDFQLRVCIMYLNVERFPPRLQAASTRS